MDDTTSAGLSAGPRRPNARGQGERLREEIISAAVQMLGDLADDEALSLRAVARAVSISPTSVYLCFPDRDALVAAAMQRCHAEMLQAADEAGAAHQDPGLGLRARILAQAAWVQEHPGLYKVMHESKVGMPFKEALFTRTTAAVQRCMDAGVASPGDAATVALDLPTAVIGCCLCGSMSLTRPGRPSPRKPPLPFQAQLAVMEVSRILNFWTLPVTVIGKSPVIRRYRGILKCAICPRQYSRSSSSVSAWPGRSLTQAQISSP